jgi:PAS domain S-box-containing protein
VNTSADNSERQIDAAADEIRRLNGCINDLTTILARPATWSGSESSQIVGILLDALLRTLHLDFTYARLAGGPDGSPSEMVRLAQRPGPSLQAADIGHTLDAWLTRDLPLSPLVVPNPVGDGTVTIACLRLGLEDDTEILVVGSARADFPTKIEMILLRVAVNQAAIDLHESLRLGEPQRAAAELEQKSTEALHESGERFRRYFDLGLVGMAITSPSKGCLEVNDELCRILGYRREELLRMTWAEMTHPEDLAADVANFNRVLAGEIDGYSMDKRWIRKDGRIIDSIMAAKCVRRSNGSVDYFVALVQDITERKRAEKEQRKLAALVENSPDFIGLASLDGSVYIVNPAGRTMVGLDSGAQVAETRILDYVAEEDRVIVQQQVLAHVLREGEWEGLMRLRHFKSGTIIPTHQHIFLIKDPGTERPVAMATIARDITERKRSEEALRAARSQLAHIARVTTMGELAASIAHEVNQPLTAVVTNGDAGLRWLSQSPPNVDEAQKAMREMVKQGHRASDVIARIRALLRKAKPNFSSVDTRELIEEVLTLTRQKVEEHGVIVRVEVAADIPPVSGDSVQLQQVLVNLILNAVESMGAARNSAGKLLVTSQCLGANEVVIAVHDSGTGIAPQYQEQLFQPFFTTKGTGLGMGLAISQSIVEAHGGRLWATSKEGQGATFHFSLPIREAN